ncbi:MAG: hypothetical protein TREMPRED_001470 [Tremellales sp. Tagirdzhanova-0007]|nr:MAG: hypothetical protein TREMPRED_001470 [Tremellales sp. Tagirdzhanova-0007]
MKTAAIVSALAAIGATAIPTAYPIYKRATAAGAPTNTQVLQYALTLENLENTLYMEALSQFSDADFTAAGYPDWVRGRYEEISMHETAHVELLSSSLGNMSVAPCNYSFPYTDVKSFVSLATVIENVGVSAYAGAAQYITSAEYLTVAAVILSTEARHQAWQMSAVAQENPWSSPYDTPLGLDMVYTIASQFITSCPSSNAALPVKAFPALTIATGNPGDNVAFTFTDSHTAVNYAIFYNGLGTSVQALDANDMATIPEGLQGYTYVLISTASSAADVTNDNIVAGPAILDYPFAYNVANPSFSG